MEQDFRRKTSGDPTLNEPQTPFENISRKAVLSAMENAPDLYRTPYSLCPICGTTEFRVAASGDCSRHPLWRAPLPKLLNWLQCKGCGHVFTNSFYTEAGLEILFRGANDSQLEGGNLDQQRATWAPVVEKVLGALSMRDEWIGGRLSWLDIGCGNGGLVFTASEFGFEATGIDLREEAVKRISALGYTAMRGTILNVTTDKPLHVISMADVLEHMPYPVGALQTAHRLLADRGALFISCPNSECVSWRQMDATFSNPYWAEIEHYHNFSRKLMTWLLLQCGFVPTGYSVSLRYKACMEIIAVKCPALAPNASARSHEPRAPQVPHSRG
jgi:SAM-dependent methyltransferase